MIRLAIESTDVSCGRYIWMFGETGRARTSREPMLPAVRGLSGFDVIASEQLGRQELFGVEVIDTGAWDALGPDSKQKYFEHIGSTNPARRIGTSDDVADAVLFAMTNSFLTGVTLKIDGGEPLT